MGCWVIGLTTRNHRFCSMPRREPCRSFTNERRSRRVVTAGGRTSTSGVSVPRTQPRRGSASICHPLLCSGTEMRTFQGRTDPCRTILRTTCIRLRRSFLRPTSRWSTRREISSNSSNDTRAPGIHHSLRLNAAAGWSMCFAPNWTVCKPPASAAAPAPRAATRRHPTAI